MFKKTAIVFGLVIASGSAMAAMDDNDSNQATTGSVTASSSVMAKFNKLDTNDDNVVSKSEAQADPQVAKMYESLTTDNSIKTDPGAEPSDTQPGGITLDQFKAGMEASTGGTVGEAVSGGENYTVMKDGSKKMSDNNMSGKKMSGDNMAGNKMHDDAMQHGQTMDHDHMNKADGQMHQEGDAMSGQSSVDNDMDTDMNEAGAGMNTDATGDVDSPSADTKPNMTDDAADADDMDGDNAM